MSEFYCKSQPHRRLGKPHGQVIFLLKSFKGSIGTRILSDNLFVYISLDCQATGTGTGPGPGPGPVIGYWDWGWESGIGNWEWEMGKWKMEMGKWEIESTPSPRR